MKKKPNPGLSFIPILLLITMGCALASQAPAQTSPTTSIYATALSVGGTHACALLNNGTVACWGSNSSGELGDGTYTKHLTATIVPGLNNILSISAGGEHTCALTNTNKIKCWGSNSFGQLGDGTKKNRNTPVDTVALSDEVIKIDASIEHTCAILKSGKVICWGMGLYGRLGNEDAERTNPLPLIVSNLDESISNISSKHEHTCALTTSGKVMCWGKNSNGEIGDGTGVGIRKTPVNVSGLGDRNIQIVTGFTSSCVLTNSGEVKCWGWVGLQGFVDSPVVLDTFASQNIGIAIGAFHICVINQRGEIMCLGDNDEGQLGDGTTKTNYGVVMVRGLSDRVSFIDSFFNTTCALTTNGEIWCWGNNNIGQLGNDTTENSPIPVKVIGITE